MIFVFSTSADHEKCFIMMLF